MWAEAGSEAGAEALIAETAAFVEEATIVSGHALAATRREEHGMNVPEDFKYTKEHEWVRVEGERLTVGITDFAQDALGDVVYVDVPETETQVRAGERSARSNRPSRCPTSTPGVRHRGRAEPGADRCSGAGQP